MRGRRKTRAPLDGALLKASRRAAARRRNRIIFEQRRSDGVPPLMVIAREGESELYVGNGDVMISRLDVERLHESLRRWLEGEQ